MPTGNSMKKLKDKLRLIYLPFLFIACGFIIVYSFLHWLFIIQTDWIPVKEDIVKFWLPFALPWIPVLIWLTPRIKLLRFKNDNALFFYQFIATLAIAFPAINVQEYLVAVTGKLTPLDNISQYPKKSPTRYYTLKQCYIDKNNAGILHTSSVSGKSNETLQFLIYIALPVLKQASDTIAGECSYYIGEKYSASVSNSLSDKEKEAQFELFSKQTMDAFNTTQFQHFVYLEKTDRSDDLDEFHRAVKKSNFVKYENPVVFTSHKDVFENRYEGKAGWIFKAFGIGALLWLLLLLFPPLHDKGVAKFKKGIRSKESNFKEMLDLLIPVQGYFATPIIINLNLLLFLAMVISGLGFISFKGIDLIHWGGNYRPYTTDGQWWRLLTNIFLHGGVFHLIANMAGLLFVGIFLEPLLGVKRYISIYLITGIIASSISIWWHPATVSIGASGAIFGLYGLFLAFLLFKVFTAEFSSVFLFSTLLFIGYNLLMGLTGNIDNAAHLGGLLSGFIIGIAFTVWMKKTNHQQNQAD